MVKLPRFLDWLNAIDWQWWLGEVPVRVDWWPGAELFWYAYPCRLVVLLTATAMVLSATIFFLAALKRAGIQLIWRG